MCEFALTDINADVGYTFTACIIKYKISRSQIIPGNGSTHLVLGTGLVWQIDTDLIKNVHCKSGAIKAVGRYTAGYVFTSDGLVDDFIHFGIRESASCSDGKHNGKAKYCCC